MSISSAPSHDAMIAAPDRVVTSSATTDAETVEDTGLTSRVVTHAPHMALSAPNVVRQIIMHSFACPDHKVTLPAAATITESNPTATTNRATPRSYAIRPRKCFITWTPPPLHTPTHETLIHHQMTAMYSLSTLPAHFPKRRSRYAMSLCN